MTLYVRCPSRPGRLAGGPARCWLSAERCIIDVLRRASCFSSRSANRAHKANKKKKKKKKPMFRKYPPQRKFLVCTGLERSSGARCYLMGCLRLACAVTNGALHNNIRKSLQPQYSGMIWWSCAVGNLLLRGTSLAASKGSRDSPSLNPLRECCQAIAVILLWLDPTPE